MHGFRQDYTASADARRRLRTPGVQELVRPAVRTLGRIFDRGAAGLDEKGFNKSSVGDNRLRVGARWGGVRITRHEERRQPGARPGRAGAEVGPGAAGNHHVADHQIDATTELLRERQRVGGAFGRDHLVAVRFEQKREVPSARRSRLRRATRSRCRDRDSASESGTEPSAIAGSDAAGNTTGTWCHDWVRSRRTITAPPICCTMP